MAVYVYGVVLIRCAVTGRYGSLLTSRSGRLGLVEHGGLAMLPRFSLRINWQRNSLAVLIVVGLVLLAISPQAPTADQPTKGALTSRPMPKTAVPAPLATGSDFRTGAGERRCVPLPDGSTIYVNENSAFKLKGTKSLAV